jgi:hypothetical protein
LELVAGAVPTVAGGRWRSKTLKQILMNPGVAGIAIYDGGLRASTAGDKPVTFNADPAAAALRDAAGAYVMTSLKAILTIKEWEAVVRENQQRKLGRTGVTGAGTKKYVLSGLLRCGRVDEDGRVCGRPMSGTRIKRSGQYTRIYRCPTVAYGGCGRVSRLAEPLEKLIEDLLFEHVAENAPAEDQPELVAEDVPEVAELVAAEARLERLRMEYATGKDTVTDDTFFAMLPVLENLIKDLTAKVTAAAGARLQRERISRTPEQVLSEWTEATTSGKRAILGQYLNAVQVGPASVRGSQAFDHTTIVPRWKHVPRV